MVSLRDFHTCAISSDHIHHHLSLLCLMICHELGSFSHSCRLMFSKYSLKRKIRFLHPEGPSSESKSKPPSSKCFLSIVQKLSDILTTLTEYKCYCYLKGNADNAQSILLYLDNIIFLV